MRFKRILAMPFAVLADVATLGNMGDRSFTQQVFDAEKREQRANDEKEVVKAVIEILRAANGGR